MNTLTTVSDFYQRNLFGSDTKGIESLSSYGITSRPAIEAFKVGYGTHSILKAVTEEQAKELRTMGVISAGGLRFKSSFIFPLFNTNGELVDLMGKNIGKAGGVSYLNGQPKGFAHFRAYEASKDIIATNLPKAALQLYQAGHHNVVLVPEMSVLPMLECHRLTFLSNAHSDEWALHAKAEEVLYANIRLRDKDPTEALTRLKVFKGKPRPKPVAKGKTILDKVVEDLDALGYANEANNKKLGYLVSISRKLERPLSAIIISSSGAGKSTLMRLISKLTPPEDRLVLNRITPQAFFHFPDDALTNKLIVVDERDGSGPADFSVRSLQTSRELTMARTAQRKGESSLKSIKVQSAYMESTTTANLDIQNSSRCLLLHLDESPVATEAVLKTQRLQRSGQPSKKHEEIIKWHHEFQKGLMALPVTIPFIKHITFPNHKVEFRRSQEHFLTLIEASALLNQENRRNIRGAIEATLTDYTTAYELFLSVFNESQREVSPGAERLLKTMEKQKAVTFTMRQALTMTGMSYGTLYRSIQELLNYSYLEQSNVSKGRHQKVFTILDYSGYLKLSTRLRTPEEMASVISPSLQEISDNYPATRSTTHLDEGREETPAIH